MTSLCFVILLLSIFQLSYCVVVLNGYKVVQYDEGTPFGSRVSYANLLAISKNTDIPNLNRYMVLIEAKDLNAQVLQELVSKSVGGILVYLESPKNENNNKMDSEVKIDSINATVWYEVEHFFLSNKLDIPIYFTFQNDDLIHAYKDIQIEPDKKDSGYAALLTDSYRVEIQSAQPLPIKKFDLVNIQGWLGGSSTIGNIAGVDTPLRETTEDGDSYRPIIAVVAHYDSFSAIPGLAYGTDSSASGVVALLELAHLFSKLYKIEDSRTQGQYDIIFLLTGGGHMNFLGAKEWLEHVDPHILSSIDFVLCLDGLASNDSKDEGLYLHVSRSTKDAKAKEIYTIFNQTASVMGIPFHVHQKKIDISKAEVPWQHEQFSKKKILSGTLSDRPPEGTNLKNKEPPFVKGYTPVHHTILDSGANVDLLIKHIHFIAEALARVIYNVDVNSEAIIFSDELAINSDYVSSWLKVVSSYPRMIPFISKKDNYSTIITGLEKELSRHVSDVNKKVVTISDDVIKGLPLYYDKISAVISLYRGKPAMFDVILSVSIGIYCSLIYIILKGPKEAGKQFFNLFKKT